MATNYFSPKTSTVDTALTDGAGNAVLARGTAANLPTGLAGYAIGCLYMATNNGVLYVNTGTAASATWSTVTVT